MTSSSTLGFPAAVLHAWAPVTPLVAKVGARIPSSPVVTVAVVVVLALVTQPIIRHMVRVEGDQRLRRILTWSFALHLLGAPLQIFVVNHFYHGVADYVQYTHASSVIGDNFRHFNFSIRGSHEGSHLIGNGGLTIVGGIVMVFVGSNELGTFLVFAWMSFIGAPGFYWAFSITFPDADKRRYALMLFFLPSLLFWTADPEARRRPSPCRSASPPMDARAPCNTCPVVTP